MGNNKEEDKTGILYLLTNPAMPNMVKIGITTKTTEERMSQLYSTGVPLPFVCEYAIKVFDISIVESKIHTIFSKQRVNPKREFFNLGVVEAKALFELIESLKPGGKDTEIATEEVQNAINKDVDIQSKESLENYRKRRPNFSFEEMMIPDGSIIQYMKDPDKTAIIVHPNRVKYMNKEYSLSELTKELLGTQYYVGPTPFWIYGNKTLYEIYEETYQYE